jgi:hypothetical protein
VLALLMLGLLKALRAHAARGDVVALACTCGVGAFFVHGLLDTFFAFTPLFGLFWLLLGLAAAPPAPAASPGTTA